MEEMEYETSKRQIYIEKMVARGERKMREKNEREK